MVQYRENATRMGPCYIGSVASHLPEDMSQTTVSLTRLHAGGNMLPLSDDMTESEEVLTRAENARRTRAAQILRRVSSRVKLPPEPLEYPDDPDPVEPEHVCLRWDEIAQFLFDNREPGKLALDSLDFPMPEQTMLSHVVNLAVPPFAITAEEFREFLWVCHQRRLLFRLVDPHLRSTTLVSNPFVLNAKKIS